MKNLKDSYKTLLNNHMWKSDRFHKSIQNSKKSNNNSLQTPQEWINVNFKTYPRMKQIQLNSFIFKSQLSQLLRKRKSQKAFSGKPLSQSMIARILYYSCGIIDVPDGNFHLSRRAYPSAGGRYPLETYVVVLRSDDLKTGLYHYNVKENTLETLDDQDIAIKVDKILLEKWALQASVLFIITGIVDRSRIKYSDRGYLYTLLEAGYMSQNFCLLSTSLNLNICPIGGFIDEEVSRFLDITFGKEIPVTILAVG